VVDADGDLVGVVMIWRRERARHYIEHDVEW
jgi:hypothetical protein